MNWPKIAVCLVLCLASAPTLGQEGLTDEDRADLAWLEGLGYPSGAGRPFVEIHPGGNPKIRGFLMEDSGDTFRVLGLGLGEWRFERSPPGTPEAQLIRYEKLRAEDLCEHWLAGGPSPSGAPPDFPEPAEPSAQVQVLVLAHALSKTRGDRYHALVHQMLAHARTLQHERWRHYGTRDDPTQSLRARAALDLAATELHRAKMALVGYALWGYQMPRTWTEKLDAFRAIARRFPTGPHSEEVRGYVAVLERMIREKAEHAPGARPLEELSGEERIDELVFLLREQLSDGPGTSGGPGMLTSGTYKNLVLLGTEAVPRLIEALADDSLTRYGGGGRSGMNPNVQRVGDLALMALEEIAGRRFTPPEGVKIKPYDRAWWREACRPSVEAWLAEVRSGGEAASLVRLVEKGDYDSLNAVPTLLARDPSLVADAVLVGWANAEASYVRTGFLELLAEHCGEAGMEMIRREAQEGHPWTRLPAAERLAAAGDPIAKDVLLDMWTKRRDGKGPTAKAPDGGSFRDRVDELRTVADALLALREPAVVEELGADVLSRSPTARRALAKLLAAARPDATGAFADAIDAVLLQFLEDRTEYADSHGEQIRAVGLAWRVRDVAAAALARRNGTPPPRIEEPFWGRDRHLARVDSSLEALPEIDATDLEALLVAIAGDRFGLPTRAEAVDRVRAVGLPALPALRRALAAKRFGFARDIERLVAELALPVREVRVEGAGEVGLPEALRTRLDALVGEALTAPAFDDVAWTMIFAAGKELSGASLDVYRGPDDDGVVVTLTVLDGLSGGWDVSGLAAVGERFVDGGFGGGWSLRTPRRDTSLHEMAEKALAAPSDERIWMHVRVERRPHDE